MSDIVRIVFGEDHTCMLDGSVGIETARPDSPYLPVALDAVEECFQPTFVDKGILLRNRINDAVACAAPWLQAATNPRFAGCLKYLTLPSPSPDVLKCSHVPSSDPSSTTMISVTYLS
jgi:hypothetical protein